MHHGRRLSPPIPTASLHQNCAVLLPAPPRAHQAGSQRPPEHWHGVLPLLLMSRGIPDLTAPVLSLVSLCLSLSFSGSHRSVILLCVLGRALCCLRGQSGLHAWPSGGSPADDASMVITHPVWGFDQWASWSDIALARPVVAPSIACLSPHGPFRPPRCSDQGAAPRRAVPACDCCLAGSLTGWLAAVRIGGAHLQVQRSCVVPGGLYPAGCDGNCTKNATKMNAKLCTPCDYPASCEDSEQKYDVVVARR